VAAGPALPVEALALDAHDDDVAAIAAALDRAGMRPGRVVVTYATTPLEQFTEPPIGGPEEDDAA
jgi:hypothetical protein